MPLLAKEIDLFPADLLDVAGAAIPDSDAQWRALYTISRREKRLMRELVTLGIPFYGPVVERRYRSPNGRIRTSYEPLFSNYVFVHSDPSQRYAAMTTNCVSQCYDVKDGPQLVEDLRRIQMLIAIGRPLTPETRLERGDHVRVKSGVFAGFEGLIIRRNKETRLLVALNFTKQGVSVLLDDCQLQLL